MAPTHVATVPYNSEVEVVSPTIEKYVLANQSQSSIVVDKMPANELVFNVLYDKDVIGTNPDKPGEGDGIADKYQRVVTYEVINGTSDKAMAVVTLLDESDNPS